MIELTYTATSTHYYRIRMQVSYNAPCHNRAPLWQCTAQVRLEVGTSRTPRSLCGFGPDWIQRETTQRGNHSIPNLRSVFWFCDMLFICLNRCCSQLEFILYLCWPHLGQFFASVLWTGRSMCLVFTPNFH